VYIGPKSRTESPRKTKIGTEVGHITRDSDTTFEVKRSKVNLQGQGHILAASRTACFTLSWEWDLKEVADTFFLATGDTTIGRDFELPRCSLNSHKQSFVINCLFKFIDM